MPSERSERPTCGQCYHFVPTPVRDKDDPRRDEGTCHAHAPTHRGGVHEVGNRKYSDAWAPVLVSDVACGDDFCPASDPSYAHWRKVDGKWAHVSQDALDQMDLVKTKVAELKSLTGVFHAGTQEAIAAVPIDHLLVNASDVGAVDVPNFGDAQDHEGGVEIKGE